MRKKQRVLSFIVIVSLLLCCFSTPVLAKGESADTTTQSLARATGRFNMTIKAGRIAKADTSFPLEKDDEVTINASYAPANAVVNFGLIGPDNQFYYITVEDGTINETIKVNQHGYYTFAIENTSNVDITVNGYVNY